jgi:hypothetical protein
VQRTEEEYYSSAGSEPVPRAARSPLEEVSSESFAVGSMIASAASSPVGPGYLASSTNWRYMAMSTGKRVRIHRGRA